MDDEGSAVAVTEQPHEVLQRAADVLEERAGKATPGPWSYEGGAIHHPGTDSYTIAPYAEWEDQTGNAHWICTMSPPVAAPLALWLRTDARRCKVDMAGCSSPKNALAFAEERYAGALGFARMVLGEDA